MNATVVPPRSLNYLTFHAKSWAGQASWLTLGTSLTSARCLEIKGEALQDAALGSRRDFLWAVETAGEDDQIELWFASYKQCVFVGSY